LGASRNPIGFQGGKIGRVGKIGKIDRVGDGERFAPYYRIPKYRA